MLLYWSGGHLHFQQSRGPFINLLFAPPSTFQFRGIEFIYQTLSASMGAAGQEVEPPYPMPWYPNRLAWHMNFSRTCLRKMTVLSNLHEFIKRENDAGSISRQEAVSMVPPLFLDVQPHHVVRSHSLPPQNAHFAM
jgi:hypothetical protein